MDYELLAIRNVNHLRYSECYINILKKMSKNIFSNRYCYISITKFLTLEGNLGTQY